MVINDKVRNILEWILCIVIAFVLAVLIKYFVGTPTIVSQVSMNPTLKEGQRLILNRLTRTLGEMPQRGDIITFEAPTIKGYNSIEEIDLQNPVAKYEDEPTSLWGKFTYYVLEIGKNSYIKRVIALPGEHVKIENGKVYINGEELQEDYLQPEVQTPTSVGAVTSFNDFVVPENCVFAMGDNRTQSTDCREFGCIPLEKIESKVWIRFWPLDLWGKVDKK
ncbi:MAG: signal peptidase I [Clostridia bacterium]|jgi:signal peptidase I|nr:signal peptidase I [Clostridia bacterium]